MFFFLWLICENRIFSHDWFTNFAFSCVIIWRILQFIRLTDKFHHFFLQILQYFKSINWRNLRFFFSMTDWQFLQILSTTEWWFFQLSFLQPIDEFQDILFLPIDKFCVFFPCTWLMILVDFFHTVNGWILHFFTLIIELFQLPFTTNFKTIIHRQSKFVYWCSMPICSQVVPVAYAIVPVLVTDRIIPIILFQAVDCSRLFEKEGIVTALVRSFRL